MKHRQQVVHVTRLVVVVILLLLYPSILCNPTLESNSDFEETGFLRDFNECTTGVASGLATPDSRPLLWKNRDCGNTDQEYHYVDDGRIPFIGLTYTDVTDRYFAGLNEAGFAIENSVAHNLDFAEGYSAGYIMKLALATCRSIDDFQAILDSTDENGRRDCSNFGVIDAFGGAAIFEAGRESYRRFDAVEMDEGFLIRSNFAYSGGDSARNIETYGVHRHDRAWMLWKEALDDADLTPLFIYQQVARDLSSRECEVISLPFEGYYDTGWGTLPYGWVPQANSINRSSTQSVFVAQGVTENQPPDEALIWAMVGSPLGCVFTPLWVGAGSVPDEYNAEDGCRLCERADEIRNWTQEDNFGVDTWRLVNPDGTGIYDYILPLETYLYNKARRFVNSRRFNHDLLLPLQNKLAQQAADSLDAWLPFFQVTERFEAIFENNNLVLIWEENEEQFGGRSPSGYSIYRNRYPFREGDRGELLTFVEATRYIDRDPLPEGGFYRVEIVF